VTFECSPNITMGICYSQILYLYSLNFRDTLTLSAWHLLELTKDITRAKTHFLLLTLRRSTSSNPRALYSLIEAAVLPFSVLEDTFSNRGRFEDSSPVSPKAMLVKDEEGRKREGALGSVMVLSIELPKGDNRSPLDALQGVRRFLFVLFFLGTFLPNFVTVDLCSHSPTSGSFQRTQRHALSYGE
jgi:hypothetical protein